MTPIILTSLLLSTALSAAAPEAEARAAIDSPPGISVELDLVQPFVPTVGIIKPKVALSLWGSANGLRGDLILGLFIRPNVTHDVVDTIDEYMVVAGYRQYFWNGLHAEVLLDGGVAWGTNLVDGKFYRTPTLFLEGNVGYRFGFYEPGGLVEGTGPGFFIAPQFGMLTTLGVSDIGPRNGKPDWFLQGNLLVGASF